MYFDLTLYRLMLQLAWSEPRLRPRLTALFVALVFIPLYSGATALFYTEIEGWGKWISPEGESSK